MAGLVIGSKRTKKDAAMNTIKITVSKSRNTRAKQWALSLSGVNVALYANHADGLRALTEWSRRSGFDGSARLVSVTHTAAQSIAAQLEANRA